MAAFTSDDDTLSTVTDTDNLWVVKYKPSVYTELLSEEVNKFI